MCTWTGFITRDVPIGGRGGVAPPNVFKHARKLVKRQPCCNRVSNSTLSDLFLSNNSEPVGQYPPQTKGVSAHHCSYCVANFIACRPAQYHAVVPT